MSIRGVVGDWGREENEMGPAATAFDTFSGTPTSALSPVAAEFVPGGASVWLEETVEVRLEVGEGGKRVEGGVGVDEGCGRRG